MLSKNRVQKAVIEGTRMLLADKRVQAFELAGSSMYVDEPRDVDFLVLVDVPADNSRLFVSWAQFQFEGFKLCNGEYDDEGDQWCALRGGDINLIVTGSRLWYDGAVLSQKVCEALRPQTKQERIAIYRVVRDGKTPEQARKEAGLGT